MITISVIGTGNKINPLEIKTCPKQTEIKTQQTPGDMQKHTWHAPSHRLQKKGRILSMV